MYLAFVIPEKNPLNNNQRSTIANLSLVTYQAKKFW